MNEKAIAVIDLFSGIGGFAISAEIANAMADSTSLSRTRTGANRKDS